MSSRLYALSAWRDTPFFNDRERAALALTEVVTFLTGGHVPDDVYQTAVSLATRVLNEHTNDADLCAVCGSAWLCEFAVLAEHNLAAAL